ncbi:hypothetical protein [Microbacterium sp.]|uniref:hypothetical protein n=1 Tax=Microbacterium sp. TaxID=51671 RepID=UPI0039E65B33
MARVGGRNTALAWLAGIGCVAVVAGLAFLALPMVPVVRDWAVQTVAGPTPAPARTARAGGPIECRDLYVDPLWADLVWTPRATLSPSADLPAGTPATPLLEAAQPAVRFTCVWSSKAGSISTTLAEVGTDAATALVTALPGAGFTCTEVSARSRCARTDADVVETVEVGEGLLLASVETAWHPERYAERVSRRVWVR